MGVAFVRGALLFISSDSPCQDVEHTQRDSPEP
jgi:hypothetical protein